FNTVGGTAGAALGVGRGMGPAAGPQDLMQRQQYSTSDTPSSVLHRQMAPTSAAPMSAESSDSTLRMLTSATNTTMGSEPGIRSTPQSQRGINTQPTGLSREVNAFPALAQPAYAAFPNSFTQFSTPVASLNAPASEARNISSSANSQRAGTDIQPSIEAASQQTGPVASQDNAISPTDRYVSTTSSEADARPHPYSIGLNSPFRQT
ncbi:hypothetical protein, partial [Brachymonas sp. M4Q-1]|uniref:hypothetical protein n=1 Tax=Brachymonas sp. M4Q-1 TaxID=3416906 RepID=UPI003CE8C75E